MPKHKSRIKLININILKWQCSCKKYRFRCKFTVLLFEINRWSEADLTTTYHMQIPAHIVSVSLIAPTIAVGVSLWTLHCQVKYSISVKLKRKYLLVIWVPMSVILAQSLRFRAFFFLTSASLLLFDRH